MEPSYSLSIYDGAVRYSDAAGNVCYYSNSTRINVSDTETYQTLFLLLQENQGFKDIQEVADALEYYRLEALPLKWQMIVGVIYTLTAIASFILNALTLLVLTRGRRTELRKYLINLSVSDLMMSLFSIPFTYLDYMLGRWVLPNFLCPIVRFVVTLSVIVSIGTMIIIGLNRYWAIVHPLRRARSSVWWRLIFEKNFTIGLVWLLGVTVSMPEYLLSDVTTFCHRRYPNSQVELYWTCSYNIPPNFLYEIFIFLLTFVLPLLLLTYLYSAIALKLWRRRMPGNVNQDRDSSALAARKKVIKMLSVIVVFFALHWLPIQTFILISTILPEVRNSLQDTTWYNVYVGTYFASHWLSMAHSCLNPLILYFMNDDFRSDMRTLLSARNNIHQIKVLYPVVVNGDRAVRRHGGGSQSCLAARNAGGCKSGATGSRDLKDVSSALPGGAIGPGVVISLVVEDSDRELATPCMPVSPTAAAATASVEVRAPGRQDT